MASSGTCRYVAVLLVQQSPGPIPISMSTGYPGSGKKVGKSQTQADSVPGPAHTSFFDHGHISKMATTTTTNTTAGAGVEDGEEAEAEHIDGAPATDIFAAYSASPSVRALFPLSREHPADVTESSSLASITLPPTSYPLHEAVSHLHLSQLQLEGVLYATTKHQEFLPSKQRAGFFLGDGAGVGKGRQIAAVILDNVARGRRRHLWVSASADLSRDAQRDLNDVGAPGIRVIDNLKDLDSLKSSQTTDGVLFTTYASLVSTARGRARLDQLVQWLGGSAFDGVIALDECHRAKNSLSETKVAACVLQVQQSLPNARVMYCSATGVSEVAHMQYLDRLGLWGAGTSFKDFAEFSRAMKDRGLGFMEQLAMELKSDGKYLARSLSFRGAEFVERVVQLTDDDIVRYDASATFWRRLRLATEAANMAASTGSEAGNVMKAFYAAQQRFFRIISVSMKVDAIVADARKALSSGHSVVIGLQSTGEAAAAALNLEPGAYAGWVSSARRTILGFLESQFPRSAGGGGDDEMYASLVKEANALPLPNNFIDTILDALGGPKQVAEMTGRKGRVVRDATGVPRYELRAGGDGGGDAMLQSLNVEEAKAFQSGRKLVAIISDAASTGVSLHADRRAGNQRRRVHITAELPWSADKAIQQLGRTHRSNQTSGPMYQLMVTNLGGERRFLSAVARRLQGLGALTRGDRRAASGLDLSDSHLDTPFGRRALKRMYDAIVTEATQLPPGVTAAPLVEHCDVEVSQVLANSPPAFPAALHASLLAKVKLLCVSEDGIATSRIDTDKILGDVRRFLNRLLACEVRMQQLLFAYFLQCLSSELAIAKSSGRYAEGISDLPGAVKRSHPPELENSGGKTTGPGPLEFWRDPNNARAITVRHDLTVDRGVSFAMALERRRLASDGGDMDGFYQSRRPQWGRHLPILALRKPGQRSAFVITRPNTGQSYFEMDSEDLRAKYQLKSDDDDELRSTWDAIYDATLHDGFPPGHEAGRRLSNVCLLGGSVVSLWGVLETTLRKKEHQIAKSERSMRVVRAELDDGSRVIGVRFPAAFLGDVLVGLLSSSSMDAGNEAASVQLTPSSQVEAPASVKPKQLERAKSKPRTIASFFQKKAPRQAVDDEGGLGGSGGGGGGAKRKERDDGDDEHCGSSAQHVVVVVE